MSGALLPLPHTLSWRGAQVKHGDNFTFCTTQKTSRNMNSRENLMHNTVIFMFVRLVWIITLHMAPYTP